MLEGAEAPVDAADELVHLGVLRARVRVRLRVGVGVGVGVGVRVRVRVGVGVRVGLRTLLRSLW